MEHYGYIHDIKDVKVLILYVMSLVDRPVSAQTIYELCYQDDSLSYFDVQEAIPQMIVTGHLEEPSHDLFAITEKGKETQPLTEDAIAYPVKQRAKVAVDRFNETSRREQFLRTNIGKRENGEFVVHMGMDDLHGPLIDLDITAPTLQQARKLEAAFLRNADLVYQSVMIGLLDDEDD